MNRWLIFRHQKGRRAPSDPTGRSNGARNPVKSQVEWPPLHVVGIIGETSRAICANRPVNDSLQRRLDPDGRA